MPLSLMFLPSKRTFWKLRLLKTRRLEARNWSAYVERLDHFAEDQQNGFEHVLVLLFVEVLDDGAPLEQVRHDYQLLFRLEVLDQPQQVRVVELALGVRALRRTGF